MMIADGLIIRILSSSASPDAREDPFTALLEGDEDPRLFRVVRPAREDLHAKRRLAGADAADDGCDSSPW